jgi:hypothetical protein
MKPTITIIGAEIWDYRQDCILHHKGFTVKIVTSDQWVAESKPL